MEEHVQIAIDDLFEAQTALLEAKAMFKQCQAKLMIKLGTDATIEECNKLIEDNFDAFVKSPRIESSDDGKFRAHHAVPSWTLNEVLDSENADVFKRRRILT